MQRWGSPRDLELFVLVVSAGSFTAAARIAGVPPSTVSRAIARLERTIRATLIDRGPRLFRLTDVGRRLHEDAAAHVVALSEIVGGLQRTRDEPEGLLRVTCPPETNNALGELFGGFARRFPRIALDLDSSKRTADLLSEGWDVALRATARLRGHSGLVARKLYDGTSGLYASPEYLGRHGMPTRVESLGDHEFILDRARASRARLRLHGPTRSTAVTVQVRAHADDLRLAKSLALAGLGIAALPTRLADEDVPQGRLLRLLPAHHTGASAMYVVYRKQRDLPAKVVAFRDFAVQAFRSATR